MSTVAFGNWEMQADDPGDFAFRLAFLPNPHGSDDRATEEDRESWGAFSIWAHGENLCAHIEQGERSSIPCTGTCSRFWSGSSITGIRYCMKSGCRCPTRACPPRNPSAALDNRHFHRRTQTTSTGLIPGLRGGRGTAYGLVGGGPFPDLYLRRYRDRLEPSTGAEPLPGTPDEFTFQTPNRTYRVDLLPAAEALFSVVSNAVSELERRLPQSSRIKRLSARIADLTRT